MGGKHFCLGALSRLVSVLNRSLMMMTEMALETSVSYRHLTQLIAREDFIEFSRHESSRTYNFRLICSVISVVWLISLQQWVYILHLQ